MKELPPIVYKYFNWEDTESRKILTERELYFCNARKWKNFGEYSFAFKPIDKLAVYTRLEKLAYKMRNRELPLFEKWFNIHVYKYRIDTGNPHSLSPIEKDLWEVQIVDQIIQHRVDEIARNTPAYELATKNFYYKRTGIFSTSLTKDSQQLWDWKNTYQHNYNGSAVCVGLDLAKIKSKLDVIRNYSLGPVKYEESINEVDFTGSTDDFFVDRLNSITFTLKKDAVAGITEQQELRIMRFLTDKVSPNCPDRFLKLDDDCITEIIVHAGATEET
ncbi:MAG: hypothetical protein JNL59_07965, partial [Chitinophagaceae bacterium]|nr:hypothetical protein [Chitinophagaceae bacterium]